MDLALAPVDAAWQPVSPQLARMRRTVVLVATGLLAVAGAVLCVVLVWLGLVVLALALGLLAWGLYVIPRNYRSWAYAEREDDFLVRHGVMFRTLVVVPYGRMQLVDVEVGPLERAFGIARLQLHTAAATTDARIVGLAPEEAARLRDRLASRGEAQSAGL